MDDLQTIGRFARLAGLKGGTFRLQRVLHILGQLSSEEPDVMTTAPAPSEIDPTTRRTLAVDLFNHVWTLLEKPDRTPEQDDEMMHAQRCVAINEANGTADWDIAAACEAMARAYLTAGDLAQVAAWKAKAQKASEAIADPTDRELIEGISRHSPSCTRTLVAPRHRRSETHR